MLLIKSERETLLKPLSLVCGIVEKKHTLPILANVLVEKSSSTLTMTANDLEIQISHQYHDDHLSTLDDFKFTVSAKKLQEILRSINDQSHVEFHLDNEKMMIKATRSKYQLQTLPATDFPKINEINGLTQVIVTQRILKNLLKQVQYAMAQQDIRYFLNGLCLITNESILRMVATDGHRMALAEENLGVDLGKQQLILPRKTVLELNRLLSDNDNDVIIAMGASQIKFTFNGTELISKVIDGNFPDYQRVIPKNNQRTISLHRENFLHALQRVSVLSDDKFRGTQLLLENNLLRIVCRNNNQEEAEELIEVDYAFEPLEINFNITYLQDVLMNTDSEYIVCALSDNRGSVLFSMPDNQSFKYVVMPLRS